MKSSGSSHERHSLAFADGRNSRKPLRINDIYRQLAQEGR